MQGTIANLPEALPPLPAAPGPLPRARWQGLAVACFTLSGAFALRCWLLGAPSLWYDEGVSWSLASSPPSQLLARLAAGDFNPPLYLLLLHWWLPAAGQSEYALRLPSAFAGVLSVALCWVLARRAFQARAAAATASFLAATSVFLVDFSGEARGYALAATASLLSAYALLRLTTGSAARSSGRLPGSRRWWNNPWWWGYLFATAAALYCHYATALLLSAHLPLVLARWRRGGRSAALALPGVGLLFSPWLPSLRSQLAVMATTPDYWSGSGMPLLAPERAIAAIVAGPGAFPNGGKALLALAGIALVLSAAAALARRRNRPPATFPTLLVILPLLEAALITTAVPKFIDRYLLPVAPFAYVAAAGGLTWGISRFRLGRAPARRIGRGGFLALTTLVLLAAGAHALRHAPQGAAAIKDGDTRAAVAFIAARAEPGDAVVLAQDTGPVFAYYYDGALGGEGVGWFPVATEYTRGDDLPRLAAALNTAAAGHRRLWVLFWHEDFADPTGYLRNALSVKATQLLRYDGATNYDLRLFALRPDSQFSPLAAPLRPMTVQFGPYLTFLGDGLEQWDRPADAPFVYHTWFRTDAPLDRDYQAVLRLERDGHVWAQAAQRPSVYTYPAPHWLPGIDVPGRLEFTVGPTVPPGEYHVTLAVYDPAAAHDLPVVDAGQGALGTKVDLGAVRVLPPDRPAQPVVPARPVVTSLLPGLHLLGTSAFPGHLREGAATDLTLYWQAGAAPRPDVSAAVELVTSAGTLAITDRAPPAPGLGTASWPAGDTFQDYRSLRLPARLPAGPATLQVRVQPLDGGAPIVVSLGAVAVEARARQMTEPPELGQRLTADFGNAAVLAGVQVDDSAAQPGGHVVVTLYWQCRATLEQEYTVFVHLLDAQNAIGGRQHDGPPNAGNDPTTSWLPGQWIIDRHEIPIPPGTPPGSYRIEVGLYRQAGEQFVRLPLAGGGDAVIAGAVDVRP